VTDDDPGAFSGAPPRLTIGQRILAALPNLQRATTRGAPSDTDDDGVGPSRAKRPRTDVSTADVSAADADGDSDVDADTSSEVVSTAATAGIGGRLLDSVFPPTSARGRGRPVDDLDSMTREEITHRIKKLDDRERFLALTAAPLGVLVGIVLTAFTFHFNPPLHVHGKLNPKHVSDSLILLEGGARILLSGIVVVCALSRRRSLVGFALLFLGTAMGSPLFALPFWVLGGYLIWRVFKYQKVLTARGAAARGATRGAARGSARTADRGTTTARAPGGKRVPANPRAAGRAGAAAARERVQSRGRRGRKEPAPTGPTPSKRYTPPRPTRPRPPVPPS
jgi:hypothetical protein